MSIWNINLYLKNGQQNLKWTTEYLKIMDYEVKLAFALDLNLILDISKNASKIL